jgi:hypothetical protein
MKNIENWHKAVEKAGGEFKLVVLIQKRIKDIVKNTSLKGQTPPPMPQLFNSVIDEILSDKIIISGDDKSTKETKRTKK